MVASRRGRTLKPKTADHTPKLVGLGSSNAKNISKDTLTAVKNPGEGPETVPSVEAEREREGAASAQDVLDAPQSPPLVASDGAGTTPIGPEVPNSRKKSEDVGSGVDESSKEDDGRDDASSLSSVSSNNAEAWEREIDVIPFTQAELKDVIKRTPSHWSPIQPIDPASLPISATVMPGPTREDFDMLLETYKVYPFNTSQDPNEVRKRLGWKPRRGGEMASFAGSDLPILFSIVGRVSRNGTYCSADANWKPHRPGLGFDVPFPDVKIRLVLEAIPEPGLQEAFDQSIHFLRTVTNSYNVFDKLDVFCGNPKNSASFPLSHALFEDRSKSGDASKYSSLVFEWLNSKYKGKSITKEGLKKWQIEEWPALSAEARAELEKIRETHRALPLPVYKRSIVRSRKSDAQPSPGDWALLQPSQYSEELPSSAALVTFHLIHFAFKGKDFWNAIPVTIRLLNSKLTDAYSGDFGSIYGENADLIMGTPSTSSAVGSPKKKRLDDSEGTPSKKRKHK